MSALEGLALLAYGLAIGLVVGAGIGWLTRDREDRTAAMQQDSLLEVHNDRLRLKNRQLHEDNARLHAERRDLEEFLAVVVPSDWEQA